VKFRPSLFYHLKFLSLELDCQFIFKLHQRDREFWNLIKGDQWFDTIVQRAAKLICITPEFDDLAQEMGLESHKNGVTNEVQRGQLRAELYFKRS